MAFRRIGITAEQVEQYDLPSKPRNRNDRRSLHVERTVEAEAMPAGILRNILRTEIEALLPEDAFKVAQVEEDSVRDYFDRLADVLEDMA